jgi:hypothetical protein
MKPFVSAKYSVLTVSLACVLACSGSATQGASNSWDSNEFPLLIEVGRARGARTVLSFDLVRGSDAERQNLTFPTQKLEILQFLADLGEECIFVRPGILSNHPDKTFGQITPDTRKCLDALCQANTNQADRRIDIKMLDVPIRVPFTAIGEMLGATFDCLKVYGDTVWIATLEPMAVTNTVVLLEALCVLGSYRLESTSNGTINVRRTGANWTQLVGTPVTFKGNKGEGVVGKTRIRWARKFSSEWPGAIEGLQERDGVLVIPRQTTNEIAR